MVSYQLEVWIWFWSSVHDLKPSCTRGVARIVQRGGHRGYSRDCHVDHHAVHVLLNVTVLGWAVRVQWAGQAYKIASSQQLSSAQKLYSILTAYLSKYLLVQGGVDDEWQKCWWSHQCQLYFYIFKSRPRKYSTKKQILKNHTTSKIRRIYCSDILTFDMHILDSGENIIIIIVLYAGA